MILYQSWSSGEDEEFDVLCQILSPVLPDQRGNELMQELGQHKIVRQMLQENFFKQSTIELRSLLTLPLPVNCQRYYQFYFFIYFFPYKIYSETGI